MYVLSSANLSILLQCVQHHYSPAVSLYYHLPEVTTSVPHGVLGHYKCTLVLIALKMNKVQPVIVNRNCLTVLH